VLAAVAVERGESGESRDLLAVEGAELRERGQQGGGTTGPMPLTWSMRSFWRRSESSPSMVSAMSFSSSSIWRSISAMEGLKGGFKRGLAVVCRFTAPSLLRPVKTEQC
jgi:hypothetical protein